MTEPTLLDDGAIIASVTRVHDEIFSKLRHPRPRWGASRKWSALGLAAIVIFGGGLATGAAYVNTQAASSVPSGLLKIECASGGPANAESKVNAPRQQVVYFDTTTNSLAITPPEAATADVAKDPSVACIDEIPRVVGAIGLALPAFAQQGHHCGTITVAGYPPFYFVADNSIRTGADGQTQSGPYSANMITAAGYAFAGPVASTNCADLTLAAPTPTDPKMVTCEAASNIAMVYLDEKAAGAVAVCSQHGYPVWSA
jgi:hypothetical protein